MKPLLSPEGLKILEALSFTRALYAFDFDGTLSPIVKVPGEAALAAKTAGLLAALSRRAPVAVISGRGIEDLRRRIPFEPGWLVGNHGVEGLGMNAGALARAREACEAWLAAVRGSLDKEQGLELEDKRYSVAFHYRRCRHKKRAKAAILGCLAGLEPRPRIILGKCVVNAVPAGAPHKGVALVEIMLQAGLRSAFYVGDDDTDEDVFSLPNPHLVTARVGRSRSSRAQYFLQRQSEINRLLEALLRFNAAGKAPEPSWSRL